MLAVGRGLMLQPRLLMLDEPSLGLAPVMTDLTFHKIAEIHAMGTAILLVEQNVSRARSSAGSASLRIGEQQGHHSMAPALTWQTTSKVQAAYLGL